MTKLWFIAGLLFLLPLASAHGAPEAREFEVRTLADGTGAGDYGNEAADAGVPVLYEGAPDLLALDVREGWFNDIGGVWFRMLAQRGNVSAGELGMAVTFDVAEVAHQYEVTTTDRETWSSTSFVVVRGPFAVGDGFPYAVEGFVPYYALGGYVGTTLANIAVSSSVAGEAADVMPGGYYYQGVEISDPADTGTAGSYELQGQGQLFAMTHEGVVNGTLTLVLTSNLTEFEQFISLQAYATGVNVTGLGTGVALGAGETRNVVVNVAATTTYPSLVLVARSDLDVLQQTMVQVPGKVATPTPTPGAGNFTNEPPAGKDAKDAPGFAVVAGLGAVALAVLRRRGHP